MQITRKGCQLAAGAAVLCLPILSGCQSDAQRLLADVIARDRGQWRDVSSARLGAAPGDEPASGAVIAADAGPEQYVQLALEHNRSILAAQHNVERLKARIGQATSLDDPVFEITPIGEMAETAAGQVGLMTSISQKLPFPGKLDAKGRIAAEDAAMAMQDLRQTRLKVIADTRRAFWDYYYATRAIEVTQQTRALLQQFQAIADARYRAGTSSQADVLRASTELSNLDNQLVTLGQEQITAQAMLDNLLDRPVSAPLPAPPAVRLNPVELRLQSLLAEAARGNPELEKIRHQISSAGDQQTLAKLNYFPDLTIGGAYNAVEDRGIAKSANGKPQWWVWFGVNLPIWFGKYHAAQREALEGKEQGLAELGAAEDRIAFGVEDALVRVQTQQRLVQLFQGVILPQASQTVEASRAGYEAGRVDFLTVIDNWQKLLSYELIYHQSVAQREKDFADLEQAVGEDIQHLPPEPPTEPATMPATAPATRPRS